jgi:flagellar motor protein MotB
MNRKLLSAAAAVIFTTNVGRSQDPPKHPEGAPLYRVTVVERTIKAVNYQYRSGPTPIDFRGTVLLPEAKGGAMVESKAGRTELDAHFEHLAAPTRFGREYLTYVLWAITPEGHAKNLGEVLPGSSDKAKTHVTTDLQAFGLIVTAEPYAAVRQPSDVVVLENEIRPDTIGRIEPIQVRYDLLPRKPYIYDIQAGRQAAAASGKPVSMSEYQTTVEIYQAQNAVQIAQSQDAAKYAPEVMSKAEELLRTAQQMHEHKQDSSQIISIARQAAQTAQDASDIAVKRKQQADLAAAEAKAQQEHQLRLQAEAAAQRAQAESSADRAQAAGEARDDSAGQVAPPPVEPAAPAPPNPPAVRPQPVHRPVTDLQRQKRDLRANLLQELSGVAQVRDTPRGLVVTMPDGLFDKAAPAAGARQMLTRIASVVAEHPGLAVAVEGNSDTAGAEPERLANERAQAVRDALVRGGLPAGMVTARGLGNSRPLGPNNTAEGREENRRVEVIISGEPIGNMAYWDKSYSLKPME